MGAAASVAAATAAFSGQPSSSATPAVPASPAVSGAMQAKVAGGPGAVVQQHLQQQQMLAVSQREQFQKQVISFKQLLEAQAKGLQDTHASVGIIVQQLQPRLDELKVKESVTQLVTMQQKVAGVHQMLQQQLAALAQTQTAAQEMQLKLSQKQVADLWKIMQAMSTQVSSTQQQVHELQDFRDRAQGAVVNVANTQNGRLQQMQQQVGLLQQQLAQSQQAQETLRKQLEHQDPQEGQELRKRVEALETEVAHQSKTDTYWDEEEWV
jgi:hypothetical protein